MATTYIATALDVRDRSTFTAISQSYRKAVGALFTYIGSERTEYFDQRAVRWNVVQVRTGKPNREVAHGTFDRRHDE